MIRKGLIWVFTGDGKGKTTAALGAALRAAGQGLKVLILQFMKRRENLGELKAIANSNLPIDIKQYGRRVFFQGRTCEVMDIHMAAQGLTAFKLAVESGTYDMIILDEINMTIHFGLVEIEDVLQLLRSKPPELHVLLTGRCARPELLDMADIVTEMREIKHPFQTGLPAQKGIEF